MVVVDGQGIPLASHIDSASPAEVTLAEKTLEQIRVHDGRRGRPKTWPQRLIADKGYDSDPLRQRLKKRGITLLSPYRKNRRNKKRKIAVCETDTAEDTPSNVPSPGLIASGTA